MKDTEPLSYSLTMLREATRLNEQGEDRDFIATRFGEIRIVPGESWEPIYRAKEIEHKVVDFAWFCPHCGGEYKSRKSCKIHCAGKQGMFVATCPFLPIHQCNPNCKKYCHPGEKFAIRKVKK